MTSHNRNTEATQISSRKPTLRKRSCYVPPRRVAGLPRDILRGVLEHLATVPDTESKCRAAAILSFSQVCKAWREVAFKCAEIWTYAIDYDSHQPTWIEELLKRSSLSPLTIVGGSGRPLLWATPYGPHMAHSPREDLLLKHKERWRQLSFTSNSHAIINMKIFSQYLSKPSAKIETLVWEHTETIYRMKSPLFASHAPALRSLDLTDVWIDVDALGPISGQLEELYLSWRENSPPISILELVQLLRTTTQLRYLFLRNDAKDRNETIQIPTKRVALSRLEMISLEMEYPASCEAVMNHLTIPDKCGFLAYCRHPREFHDYAEARDLIRRRVALWDKGPSPDRVLYARRQATRWYDSFSNFELPKDTPSYRGAFTTYRNAFAKIVTREIRPTDPPLAVRVGIPRGDPQCYRFESFFSILSAFEECLPETPRLHLWIKHWRTIPANERSFLQSALSQLQLRSVKMLEVSTTYYGTLFSALTWPTAGTILLPALQTIRFVPDGKTKLWEHDVKYIKHFTHQRIDQGFPLSMIDLNGLMLREVSESDVFEELTEMVVVWD